MDELEVAIEKTREYGRKFGVEYSKRDIKERLISNRAFSDKEIEDKFKQLRIIPQGDFRMGANYELKIKYQEEKVEKAKKLAELIGKYFKDILMISITGSVAAGYPKENDDIDLMIVTKVDRLWIIRLLLRFFIGLNRVPHRKYGEQERKDDFCFNLWLEEDVLEIPKQKQTLQNAMDSILMIPILNRQGTYERFMKENKWIKKYLANTYEKIT